MRPINCGNKTMFVVVSGAADDDDVQNHDCEQRCSAVYSPELAQTLRLTAGADSHSASRNTSRRANDFNRFAQGDTELNTLISSAHRRTMRIARNRSIIVDLLSIAFGIGTWVVINSTFIQLPILVKVAPEGWNLPSYLGVMVQIGNLGPLAYTLIQKFAKEKKSDGNMIYALLVVGTVSSLLTAFFYQKTAYVFGEEHSVALFVLTIFSAITACTSSVLFMPYMGRFREIYLVTYFVGEGLSGLLPSIVALIQGIGGQTECILKNITENGEEIYESYTPPPRFDTQEFFIFVFSLMVCSLVGFTLLDRLKLARKQYAQVEVHNGNDYVYKRDANHNERNGTTYNETQPNDIDEDLTDEVSKSSYISLLVLIGMVSFFSNGIFNSILSFSCLPYGGYVYHLSATLSVIANPIACFLAIFLPHTSIAAISTLSGCAGVLTAYVMLTAVLSPTPPLHGTTIGAVIVIIAWTLLIGLVSYIKLCITTIMRSQGGKSLVWTGGLTQLGSLLGSLLIFVLINYTNSFQSANAIVC